MVTCNFLEGLNPLAKSPQNYHQILGDGKGDLKVQMGAYET